MKKKDQLDSLAIRRKAETQWANMQKRKTGPQMEPDSQQLVHELQVHQIELEMQNEELKKARNEAEIALEKYNTLFEFAPSGYFSVTCTGEILELNFQGAMLFGLERSRIINRRFQTFLKDRSLATFDDFLKKVVGGGAKPWCEVEIKTGESEPKHIFLEGTASSREENFLIVAADITRRKLAENALAEKTRLNQIILDHLPCPAMIVKGDFTLVAANLSARENGTVIGSRCYESKEHRFEPCSWCKLTEALQTQQEQHLELQVGEKYWDMHWIPISSDLALEFCFDVTDKKKTELELIQARKLAESANQAKSEFLSNMSHEIRTPLNAVIGYSQILMGEALTPEQLDYLGIIIERGNDLLALINDILDLARLEAYRFPLSQDPFALSGFLQELPLSILPIIRKKGLTYHQETGPGVPRFILGDPLRLKQILWNLLVNAVKFTETGSITLEVRLASPREIESLSARDDMVWLKFAVSDTGIGIPGESLKLIFDPFSQLEGLNSRKYNGAGLGLAICKRLAGLMNGEIRVESTPGLGSSFSLFCPFSTEVPSAEAGNTPPIGLPPGFLKSWHLLIVDDDSESLNLLKHILSPFGCKLTLLENGTAALDCLAREKIDLILLDLQMPELDGYQLAGCIRSLETGRGNQERVPIIAVSADVMNGVRERCGQAGIDDYISKPISKARMLEIILPFFLTKTSAI